MSKPPCRDQGRRVLASPRAAPGTAWAGGSGKQQRARARGGTRCPPLLRGPPPARVLLGYALRGGARAEWGPPSPDSGMGTLTRACPSLKQPHTRPSDPSPCASGEGQGPELTPPPRDRSKQKPGPNRGRGERSSNGGRCPPNPPEARPQAQADVPPGPRPHLMPRGSRACPSPPTLLPGPTPRSPTLILPAGTVWQCKNAVAAVSWAARVRCHWCRAGGGRVSCLLGQRPCQAPSFERRGGPQARVNLPPRALARWPGGAACVGGRACMLAV